MLAIRDKSFAEAVPCICGTWEGANVEPENRDRGSTIGAQQAIAKRIHVGFGRSKAIDRIRSRVGDDLERRYRVAPRDRLLNTFGQRRAAAHVEYRADRRIDVGAIVRGEQRRVKPWRDERPLVAWIIRIPWERGHIDCQPAHGKRDLLVIAEENGRVPRRLSNKRRIRPFLEILSEVHCGREGAAADDHEESVRAVESRAGDDSSHDLAIEEAVAAAILADVDYQASNRQRVRHPEHVSPELRVRIVVHRDNGSVRDIERAVARNEFGPVWPAGITKP